MGKKFEPADPLSAAKQLWARDRNYQFFILKQAYARLSRAVTDGETLTMGERLQLSDFVVPTLGKLIEDFPFNKALSKTMYLLRKGVIKHGVDSRTANSRVENPEGTAKP